MAESAQIVAMMPVISMKISKLLELKYTKYSSMKV